jgi:hydrogenase nickel incorporation protein HypA/HybF
MHELSIAQSIVDIVMEQMNIHNLSRVESVALRIGALRGIVVDSLNFGFDETIRETPMEGAKLVVETVPLRGTCLTCRQEFSMDDWSGDCPWCNSLTVEITSGKELEIVWIEGT